jgi:hypothetical protein
MALRAVGVSRALASQADRIGRARVGTRIGIGWLKAHVDPDIAGVARVIAVIR